MTLSDYTDALAELRRVPIWITQRRPLMVPVYYARPPWLVIPFYRGERRDPRLCNVAHEGEGVHLFRGGLLSDVAINVVRAAAGSGAQPFNPFEAHARGACATFLRATYQADPSDPWRCLICGHEEGERCGVCGARAIERPLPLTVSTDVQMFRCTNPKCTRRAWVRQRGKEA